MRYLVLVLAACSAPHHAAPDAAPTPLDLDVVVSPDGVFVYPNASDRDGATCAGAQFYFPEPGQDVVWDDTFSCTPQNASCLDGLSVLAGGMTYSIDPRASRLWAMVDVTASTAATLTIEGCGGTATFAIGGVPPVDAMITATKDAAADSMTATWSAPAAVTSVLLEFGAGLWSHVVHITDAQYTFVAPEQSVTPYHMVAVDALLAPSIVPTSFGDVRVWTAGRTYVYLP